jgi:hypothetical protein
MTTVSAYVREAVLKRLEQDGIKLAECDRA